MSLKHLTANDLKTRNTTSLPEAASEEIELELLVIEHKVKEKLDQVISEHAKNRVKIENTNLTTGQIAGIKELTERKDLRVVMTDKSKKMMVVRNETYAKMISAYTKDAVKLIMAIAVVLLDVLRLGNTTKV